MAWLSNGMARRKAAQVFGASVLLETSLEREVPGMNNELAHLSNLAKFLGRVATMEIGNISVI